MDYVCAVRKRVRKGFEQLETWFRLQMKLMQQCRACDFRVGLAETLCPRCGASDPARVPKSTVRVIITMSAVTLAFCLAITLL